MQRDKLPAGVLGTSPRPWWDRPREASMPVQGVHLSFVLCLIEVNGISFNALLISYCVLSSRLTTRRQFNCLMPAH